MPYGPTCFMKGGHKVRPYVQIGNIKTFAPLVRRGRPYVGPVYPVNTRSFVTFGRIVTISGGHASFRADIKSAHTCKFETLTPLMPYAPLVRRGRPCVGPVHPVKSQDFLHPSPIAGDCSKYNPEPVPYPGHPGSHDHKTIFAITFDQMTAIHKHALREYIRLKTMT